MDEHETPHTSAAPPSTGLRRWVWLSAGVLLVALGGIGVVVPGMPTTVFFIGAAACFARSSPRFEQWVLDLPHIGPLVRDYRSGLGMPRRAKIIAVTSIVTAILISSMFIPVWKGRIAAYALALLGVWFVLRRVPTRERVLAARASRGRPD
jgi:uncharacterized membrane protein YbaN (DUF454 family)